MVLAQRAGDNALQSAEDAFGTTIGTESIGIYTSGSARGFSPSQAGNVRIEGLYFDQQTTGTPARVIRGNTVRVGISAQSYAFPAPTGIVDYQLRIPGDRLLTSVVASQGPYEAFNLEFDSSIPVVDEKLSVGVGGGAGQQFSPWRGSNYNWTASVIGRWRPADSIEIIPFWSRREAWDWESWPMVFSEVLPPPIPRIFYSQDWADWQVNESLFGSLARVSLPDNWTLRAGLFRSINDRPQDYVTLHNNVQADGTSFQTMLKDPPQHFNSNSGEVRLARVFTEGPRRHTVQLMARGRTIDRRVGGAAVLVIGPSRLGVKVDLPEPAGWNFTPGTGDKVKQAATGLSYGAVWAGLGEVSLGAQKAFYGRDVAAPNRPLVKSRSNPWLYNATAAGTINTRLSIYASYTRGIEESGNAPEIAVNRGEGSPASLTEQIDAGLRFALTPAVKLVAGVFEVKKPYFDIDTARVFRQVGEVTHRGVELSLTGQAAPGLTVVAGTVLLRARVVNDATGVTTVPLGRTPRVSTLNLQYGPVAWRGVSLDTQIENASGVYLNRSNTVRIPGRTVLNVGARYRFTVGHTSATLRGQVQNATDVFRWNPGSNGILSVLEGRRYFVSLTADF